MMFNVQTQYNKMMVHFWAAVTIAVNCAYNSIGSNKLKSNALP